MVDSLGYWLFNPDMTFRRKLTVIIFLVGLLPALAMMLVSVYLLNSTLNRVASVGMETSLQEANSLVGETQAAIGRLLALKVDSIPPSPYPEEIEAWRKTAGLDIAYMLGTDQSKIFLPDSHYVDHGVFYEKLREGPSHLELDGRYYIVYTQAYRPGQMVCGGGILMPDGYGNLGRRLAGSISASASLGMYKAFSLKLLAVVTIIAIVLVLAVGLFGSTLVSRQLVRPLEALGRGARQIGGGDLSHRVVLGGHDEFSRLADSFNTMAGEIAENQEKLLAAQRLAAWREVARRIAHEIKNPLTPINIELYRLSERLSIDDPGTAEARKSLEAIQTQITALRDLALQFSTFAREPELKPMTCALEPLIAEAVAVFANDPRHTVTLSIPDNLPPLRLDPHMMNRVILNLIKNSLEASPDCASVEIAAALDNDRVVLTLRDHGPGFPDEKLQNLDKPYFPTKKSGTGLGLVIAKKIIDEHGGVARFYNDSGAVVEISLPIP